MTPTRLALALLALSSPALHAQTAGADAPTSRDITQALTAELARICNKPDGTAVSSPCTPTQVARVVVYPTPGSVNSSCQPVNPAQNPGQTLTPVVTPVILDGRTFVEAGALFGALGIALNWNGQLQRVTGVRNDFTLELTMGNRSVNRIVNGYAAPEYRLDAGLHPFVAVVRTEQGVLLPNYSKTLLPLAAVGDLTGSEVCWDGANRTARVTRGSAWFYDRKVDGSGADIMFTELRYVGPGGSASCASGQRFDWKARYCVDSSGNALGNFPASYRTRAQALGIPQASSNSWPLASLLQVVDTTGLTGRTVSDVVSEMQSNPEIFGLPYDNHDISTPGLFSLTGGNLSTFSRSEAVLPPFVMSGRRQTDQMVRTIYALLPQSVRDNTAFLLPDRVAQNPEAYIPYIQSKQQVVLIGSFKGARSITSETDPLHAPLLTRHHRELFKLRTTLALVNALNKPVIDVFYGMGDSKTTFANGIRSELQTRLNRTLTAAGYANLVSNNASRLTWGADELPAIAMAKQLQNRRVFIHTSNANALHVWDALATTTEVINEKLPSLGLTRVNTAAEADFEVYILNREPAISTKITQAQPSPDGCPPAQAGQPAPVCKRSDTGASCTAGTTNCRRVYNDNDRVYIADRSAWTTDIAAQNSHDQSFVTLIGNLPADRRAKSVIIDARAPNGAWNKVSAPATTDWLTYSAWGTFANNLGLALAQAKALHHARVAGAPAGVNVTANARRLYLEAVAHDVYANGYFEGQRNSFETTHQSFRERLTANGLTFVHQQGYSADDTHRVFTLLNTHVNERMRAHFTSLPTTTRFHVNAQFWRTFESEVHMYPVAAGELLIPGLFRTGSVPGTTRNMAEVLSPLHPATGSDVITRLTLRSLTGQEPGLR